MRRLSNFEIKKVELEILLEFHHFCSNHKLKYSLAGGTLLGAIRHKGFIPWDDDIDVCMPRPDYEKFLHIFYSENPNIEIISSQNDGIYIPFAKMINRRYQTLQKYSFQTESKFIWMDIFPIDGLPDSFDESKNIYRKTSFYRTLYMLCDAKLGEGKSIVRKCGKYFLKPIANMIGKQCLNKKIESIALSYTYDEVNYVGSIAWGLYGIKERVKKTIFELPYTDVSFEGHSFKAFGDWNEYLTRLYGDYMKLPPLDERVNHDMVVYDTEGE